MRRELVRGIRGIFSGTKPSVSLHGQEKEANRLFNDFESIFQTKSNWDIWRSLFVLGACSSQTFVNYSPKLFVLGEKILPAAVFNGCMHRSFYEQYASSRTDLSTVVAKLKTGGLRPILAVPIEEDHTGKCKHKDNFEVMLDCVRMTSEVEPNHPMMQLKITAVMPTKLLTKLSRLSLENKILPENIANHMNGKGDCCLLSKSEKYQYEKGLEYLREISDAATEEGVRVLVDAEYTFINAALRSLTLAMMLNYNQSKPLIWYTYQCYLKEMMQTIQDDLKFAENNNVCFGAKVVRGAYILAEAKTGKLCDSLEHTHENYNKIVELMLKKIAKDPHRINMIVASHNEESVVKAIQRMNELNLRYDDGNIFFGQIYGMCDHVSYSLGKAGYLVFKSIPYGTIGDTLLYLSRRAQENSSITLRTQKEKSLLWSEAKRRMSSSK